MHVQTSDRRHETNATNNGRHQISSIVNAVVNGIVFNPVAHPPEHRPNALILLVSLFVCCFAAHRLPLSID